MKMDLATYRTLREQVTMQKAKLRNLCFRCRQPDFNCLCPYIETFDPKIKFVVLIHSIEARRRVATGRLAHLCLEQSELITGHDFSRNERVNALVNDPLHWPVLLYPGPSSRNLTEMNQVERTELIDRHKKPVIFVIDGTWSTAKKMVRLSENLLGLPKICFTPPRPSGFKVRKQPKAECFSTIEAIHHTIELLGQNQGFDLAARGHDRLLHVFDKMVGQQLEYVKKSVVRHVRYKPVA